MKIAESIQLEDEVVAEIKIPIKRDFRKIGDLRPTIKGGKIFVYHEESRVLGHAKVEAPIDFVVDGANNPRIEVMPNCAYLEALNLENAIKRLKAGKILFTT